MHRFYAPGFSPDSPFDLPADEAEHLARVLRLRPGDEIAVFDGAGGAARASVVNVSSRRVTVRVVGEHRAAPEADVAVTLCQALLKSDKMDRVIRDAVMLGVAAVQPFVSRRTDVPIGAVRKGGRQDRWDRTVVSSVKQCGRAVVPPVHATKEFSDLLRASEGCTRFMLVEPCAAPGLTDLAGLQGPRPNQAMVLVGPEGGWDPHEIAAASNAGVTLLTFGARILRADAAAAVVLPVLRYIWRDV